MKTVNDLPECFCKMGMGKKWPSNVSVSGIIPYMGWDQGSCKHWSEGTLKNCMLDCALHNFYLKHTPSWAEFGRLRAESQDHLRAVSGPSEGRVGPSEGRAGPSEGQIRTKSFSYNMSQKIK